MNDQAGYVIFRVVFQGHVLENNRGLLRVIDRAQNPGQRLVGNDACKSVASQQKAVARPNVENAEILGSAARPCCPDKDIRHS